MFLDKLLSFFRKKIKYTVSPYKLKRLLEDDWRKRGFLFSIPTYDELSSEWRHPNWTGTFNVILGYIKAGREYMPVKNKKNEFYVVLPLSDVQKEMRVYFRKPEKAQSKTDPFFICRITIKPYHIR